MPKESEVKFTHPLQPMQYCSVPAEGQICVYIEKDGPKVHNTPDKYVRLFVCEVEINGEARFCIVYGPERTCNPKNLGYSPNMVGVKIAVGAVGKRMKIYSVTHGQRFSETGGFVISGEIVVTFKPEEKSFYFCGYPIPPENVYELYNCKVP